MIQMVSNRFNKVQEIIIIENGEEVSLCYNKLMMVVILGFQKASSNLDGDVCPNENGARWTKTIMDHRKH